MSVKESIAAKLTAAFRPLRLDVVDDSARHKGHAGWREGGETHFNVIVVSELFAGLSRLDRQRQVYAVLKDELAGPVHALAVKALAPGEDG